MPIVDRDQVIRVKGGLNQPYSGKYGHISAIDPENGDMAYVRLVGANESVRIPLEDLAIPTDPDEIRNAEIVALESKLNKLREEKRVGENNASKMPIGTVIRTNNPARKDSHELIVKQKENVWVGFYLSIHDGNRAEQMDDKFITDLLMDEKFWRQINKP